MYRHSKKLSSISCFHEYALQQEDDKGVILDAWIWIHLRKRVLSGGSRCLVQGFVLTTTCHSHLYSTGNFIWAPAEKSHGVEVHCCKTACPLSPGVDAMRRSRSRLLRSHLLPAVTPEPAGERLLHICAAVLKNTVGERDDYILCSGSF